MGFIRRNALVPVPHVESFHGLTTYLLEACDGLLSEDHYRKLGAIQALFDTDLEVMRDLPGIGFDACTWLSRRVDRVGNIDVHGVKYFVGSAYTGQRVHVGLRAFTVEARTLVGDIITTHPRVYGGSVDTIRRPEQLLAGLKKKPGALLNSPLQDFLPQPLLRLLTNADTAERRRLLHILDKASRLAGFDQAVTVMQQIAVAGRPIQSSEIEMVATRAREQPAPDAQDTPDPNAWQRVDLSVYDQFTGAAV